jgi:hypothetical protein
VLLQLVLEQRELVAARHAARSPEVEDHGPAAERRELEGLAVEGRAADRGRGLTSRQGRGRPVELDDGDDRERREDGDAEADEDEPATRVEAEPPIERGGRDAPACSESYRTCSVPVIAGMGWTEQMKT